MNAVKIPFLNLRAQYLTLKPEIDSAIQTVIDETAFVGGKYVSQFETSYAQTYGVKHCIGCGNGTDAIYIVLKSLGIGPGDEVITTAMSWIATSETITQTGATPVFVDIDPEHYTIDADLIEKKITQKTRAILPVHLYGQMADMPKIQKICEKYKLYLVEDCAQAHFAEFNGKKAGTFGIASTFSFYPGKNLGAYGDAGAIVTNDDALARKMRLFAHHGMLSKHHHEIEGINSRLDGIQAAVLCAKLPHVESWNQRRRENAELYTQWLSKLSEVKVPEIRPHAKPVFHLYVVRLPNRDQVQKRLLEKGVETQVHYPTAMPFMPAYSYLNHKPEDFPSVWKMQQEILSLPIYPELSRDDIQFICSCLKNSLS